MRKTLLYESCCEIVLFTFIEHDRIQIHDLIDLIGSGRIPWSLDIEMKQLNMDIYNRLHQKEKELARFGVQSRKNGILTDDFAKWYRWWKSWYISLPKETIYEIRDGLIPSTGEMSINNILKYRPPGRWQDMPIKEVQI